jgi:hypothetical protein
MSHESRFWTVNCVETPNSTLSMTLKASSLLVGFTATYFSLFSNSQFFFFFFFGCPRVAWWYWTAVLLPAMKQGWEID